jgi:hypothetical protein
MEIPIINGWTEKVDAIYTFLTKGSTMLFIIGLQGHEGKKAATKEAVERWKDENFSKIISLSICVGSGLEYKESYLNLETGEVKIIVQINNWNEHWIAMAKEWGASAVLFRRPL